MKKTRNYGIDALRLLAMCMIVVLHVCGHGKVRLSAEGNGVQFAFIALLVSLAKWSINGYALISGFVAYSDEEKPFNYYKYCPLWLSVFFYSVALFLIHLIVPHDPFTLKEALRSFFPVSGARYWYFAAYTGLFFLIPWLNKLMRSLTIRQANLLAATVFGVFSVYAYAAVHLLDTFHLIGGYSAIWLIMMYILGAWVKKCNIVERIRTSHAAILTAVVIAVTYIMILVGITPSYISPVCVLTALGLLILFAKMNVGKAASRVISLAAPAAFGVYLIHDNYYFRQIVIADHFAWVNNLPAPLNALLALLAAFGLFLACLIVEEIRLFLFDRLRINKGFTTLCKTVFGFFARLIGKLFSAYENKFMK